MTRRPAALLALVLALVCTLVLASCGGDSDKPATKPKPRPPAVLTFDLSSSFTDPGGAPSTARIDEILAATDNSGEGCPVGDRDSFIKGPAIRVSAEPVPMTYQSGYGMFVDKFAAVNCESDWLGAEVTKTDGKATPEQAIRRQNRSTGGWRWSKPQAYIGGQAWVGCYLREDEQAEVCGGNWMYKDLLISTSLRVKGFDDQTAVEWFSQVLPGWVGAKAGASSSPYSSDPVTFTDNDGWIYKFTPNFPKVDATWTKSTVNSPPGKARLLLAVDLPGFAWNYVGDTPGRQAPEAPQVDVAVIWPSTVELGIPSALDTTTFDCHGEAFARDGDGAKLGLTAGGGMWCGLTNTFGKNIYEGAFRFESEDADEGEIDQLISDFRKQSPSYYLDFSRAYDCNVFYNPNGRIVNLAKPTCDD